MRTTIYAILRDGRTGEDVKRVELGKAILDDGRMSARTYDAFKRQLDRDHGRAPKAHAWRLETAEGLRDTFGGYPALGRVRFE